MNINYENDGLKPYEEPNLDLNDNQRIGMLIRTFCSGTKWVSLDLETIIRDTNHTREQILDSLTSRKYDDIMAHYLLLGIRQAEVNEIVTRPFVMFH